MKIYYSGDNRNELSPQEEVSCNGRLNYVLSMTSWEKKSVIVAGDSYGLLAKRILDLGAVYVYSFDIASSSKYIEYIKTIYSNNFKHDTLSIFDLQYESIFDIAIFCEVIEHLPPRTETRSLNLLFKSLKNEGEILLSTPHSSLLSFVTDPAAIIGHRHYSSSQIRSLLSSTGFKDILITRGGFIYSGLDLLFLYFFKWILRKNYKSMLISKLDGEYPHQHGLTLFAYGKKTVFVSDVNCSTR